MEEDYCIQGFRAVPAKWKACSSVIHWLFIKRHSVRNKISQKPVGRTLFVTNVPPYCDEKSLQSTFSICGKVLNVYCHESPNPFLPPPESSQFFETLPRLQAYKVAYVVFATPEDLSNAFTVNESDPLILCEDSDVTPGIVKWCVDYYNNIKDPEKLQEEIDLFMQKFDKEEGKRTREAQIAGEEDEEGWITVTSKSRKRGIARTEGVRKKILEKEKLKRSKRELKNFYTFQIRESKMKHLVTLRQKFEEDKKKVNAFKQTRRFKPF